jgi:hypothetical protein
MIRQEVRHQEARRVDDFPDSKSLPALQGASGIPAQTSSSAAKPWSFKAPGKERQVVCILKNRGLRRVSSGILTVFFPLSKRRATIEGLVRARG